MSEQRTGLRFDIYERVHLAEDDVAIHELDEIELTPHIEVVTDSEQAILKGNLRLIGKYAGEGEGHGGHTIDHQIPVEITLPMNRIQRLDDIAVEIEHFDIDLLSPRSLNVTGILSLRGIEVVSSVASEQWDEEEEIVFVHQAERAEETQEEENERQDVQVAGAGQLEVTEEAPITLSNDEEILQEHGVDETKSELKIAFMGKKELESKDLQDSDVSAWLHSSRPVEQREPPAPEVLDDQGIVQAEGIMTPLDSSDDRSHSADSLEWKKLFLHTANEEQQFLKVKMCIVQREETIETIAERYSLNPREIVLYNRLGEEGITEGQLIYIPK